MADGARVKIISGVVILLTTAFVLLAFSLIPRIYNLSASADFAPGNGVYDNPLMGYANRADQPEEAQTGQLVYIDVTWAEWEPEEGHFDIKGLEERNHIRRWKDEGKHAVLRFVCDVPGREKHMDIPRWLYEKTGDGIFYDTDYGMGYAPVYDNPDFLEAHGRALAALGNYCSRDTFVSYVQLGSLGHWGEWHTKYEDGVPPMPDADVCWEYAGQYADSFIHARLLMRRNYVMAVDGGMGLYNDMTGMPEDTLEWLDWQANGGAYETPGRRIPYTPVESVWNSAPVGGEFTGSLSMEQMLGEDLDQTLSLIDQSHMTFIGPHVPEGEMLASDGAEEILRHLGYRYRISHMDIKMDYLKQSFKVKLVWENDGAAPVYFEWPVMMYIYDAEGTRRYWEGVDVELMQLTPGKTVTTVNNIPFNDLFRKGYTIGIGILDPQTGEPGIELAMNKLYQNGINIIYSYDGNAGTVFGEE